MGIHSKKSSTTSSSSVAPVTSSEVPVSSAATQKEKQCGSLASYVSGTEVLKAEVLWAMKCITSHYSMKSCDGMKQLFQAMFPDSNIAAAFSCGETKARYLCTFGLGPYFSSELTKQVKAAENYVFLFDETLNQNLQEKQLDVYVRFWDRNCVLTRYFDSKFMGHATAEVLLEELNPLVTSLGHSKLLQLSMDGPNVNKKLERMLKEDIAKQSSMKMIEIGTCGLHVLHNAFRAGCAATPWDLETLISSCYHLFHDSPARREDFLAVSGAAQFPMKFCKHRWLENADPAQRVIDILPNIVAYCTAAKSKKVTQPTCKSFTDLVKCLGDPLLKSKLEFFITIAREIEPFLSLYQTDRPMIPFLFEDLGSLIKDLMTKIVKTEVLGDGGSLKGVMHVDLRDGVNLREPGKVDIGFCAKRSILTTKASDSQRFAFRVECRDFVKALLLKVLDKAPVKYKLVQNLSWMQLKIMCSTKTKDQARATRELEQTLNILHDAGRVRAENCDMIKRQYSKLCQQVLTEEEESFRNFNHKEATHQLDRLFHEHIGGNSDFQLLWKVIQQLLLLSHGQATVERGFSINKETTVENLKPEGLKARRHIFQVVQHAGSVLSVPVTKEMLSYASSAYSRYQVHLEEQRQEEERRKAAQKRKAEEAEIHDLKKKRSRMFADAEALEDSANKKAEEAETKARLTLIAESNALRKKSQEKRVAVNELDKLIAEKTGGK